MSGFRPGDPQEGGTAMPLPHPAGLQHTIWVEVATSFGSVSHVTLLNHHEVTPGRMKAYGIERLAHSITMEERLALDVRSFGIIFLRGRLPGYLGSD